MCQLRALFRAFSFVFVVAASAQTRQPQTITILPVADQIYGVAPFQVVALASSNLPVTLTVSGPAILSGLENRLLTITGIGIVTITAQQTGNSDYAPTSAELSFTVKPGTPSIQFNPATIIYGTPLDSNVLNASATATPGFDPAMDVATVTSQFGFSQITGGSTPNYPWTSPVFRFEGPPMATSANGAAIPDPSITVARSYRVAFTCDCQQFEFEIQPNDRYRLWVDEVWTTPDWVLETASSSENLFYLVRFPDKRPRQIKIGFTNVTSGTPFFGVFTSGEDTLSAPQVPVNPSKLVFFGDSWTEPTITQAALPPYQNQPGGGYGAGYGEIAGEYLNLNWWESGLGGTGFLNPGAANVTFLQREQTDLCEPAPDIVVVLGGLNDGQGYSVQDQENAATQFFSRLFNCLPNAEVFFLGPQMSRPNSSAAYAAAAPKFPFIHYVDPSAESWFYGDPTDPTTGNEYLYFNNSHPTAFGHDYWAEKVLSYILTATPSLTPQTYPLFNPAPIAGTYSYSVADGSLLPAGQHQISVTFIPQDSAHYSTVMQNAVITVARASSSIALSASGSNVNSGAAETLAAKVSPQIGGIPTGTVSFLDNGIPIGSAVLDSSGNASFTTTLLAIGVHQISASYSGDGNFYGSSTASAMPIVVAKPDFSMSLDATQVTIPLGQSASLALTVSPIAGLTAKLNLSCTGLPANASCSLQNAQYIAVVNQHPVTTAVLIQAFTPMGVATAKDLWNLPGGVQLCEVMGVVLILKRKNRRAFHAFAASVVLLMAAVVLASSCGPVAKIKTPEPGTYDVKITLTSASDATLTHFQTVTVVIP